MLTDKLNEKNQKKQRQQFKNQIQHMANKPSFTLMDYKMRINDQLTKVTKGLKAKFSADSTQRQKALTIQKRILDAVFEQQLIQEKPLKGQQKKQISLVTQVPLQNVNKVLKNVYRYKNMHKLLRGMKQKGQSLPQDMQSLQYAYLQSGIQQSDGKNRYQKYKSRSRIQRGRLIKWDKL